MIWAIKEQQRIKATPKDIAFCPICNEEVIAKCGSIKIWHWSHKSLRECDTWAEPESEWHINWKNEFPKEQQEVIIGHHRADIKTKSGMIIELQHSPLNLEKIRDRERFYENMCWLLDGNSLAKGLNIYFNNKTKQYNFRWSYSSKSFTQTHKPLFVDIGNYQIFLIQEYFYGRNNIGKGMLYEKEEFLKLYGDIYGAK